MDNKRKFHTVLGGTLVAMLPCFAAASPPSDAAVGQIDAILDFCVKAVPRLSSDAHTYRALFAGNGSSGSRSSKAYHEGYEQVSLALAKGNVAKETAACTVGLAHEHHDDSRRHDDDHKEHR